MKKLFLILAFTFLVSASGFGQTNDNIALGNPSNAKADLNQPNYLVTHKGYTLSYNKERGAANWVAWHLEKPNIGSAERTNAFAPDTSLPADWWIKPFDYTGTGYDKGHMCPSKDRSDTAENNRVTFLMSNMQPQLAKLNQKTWKYLEDYTRETVGKRNEAYVYAGCYGDKGKLNNKVTIQTNCFKIIVVLPEGGNDLKRINNTTRVIAVDMPNDESVSIRWRTYLRTVDDIEKKTGFDFLSNISKKIQKAIESKKEDPDAEPQQSEVKAPAAKTNSGEREYHLGSRGGCYYLTESGKKSYVDKKYCSNIAAPTEELEVEKSTDKRTQTNAPAKPESGGRTYIKGSRGGCYYINSSGKKTYVDRSLCN